MDQLPADGRPIFFKGRSPKPQALQQMEERHLDPAETGEDIEELFLSSLSTLRSARSAAVDRIKLEEARGTASLTDLIKAQKELAATLKMAMDMEQQINDWNRRHTGEEITSDVDVDLDIARHEIGCRLDRLRACCASE